MDARLQSGSDTILLKIQHAGELTKQGIRQGFFSLGRDLKAMANEDILRRPKKGRTYVVRGPSGRKRRHVASAPGESHANLSGKARRSIGWKVYGAERLEFGYGAGPDTPPDYVDYLEHGTSRMAARPSIGNSVAKNLRNADVHFIKQITRRFEV